MKRNMTSLRSIIRELSPAMETISYELFQSRLRELQDLNKIFVSSYESKINKLRIITKSSVIAKRMYPKDVVYLREAELETRQEVRMLEKKLLNLENEILVAYNFIIGAQNPRHAKYLQALLHTGIVQPDAIYLQDQGIFKPVIDEYISKERDAQVQDPEFNFMMVRARECMAKHQCPDSFKIHYT